jgi:hypothetical protein
MILPESLFLIPAVLWLSAKPDRELLRSADLPRELLPEPSWSKANVGMPAAAT